MDSVRELIRATLTERGMSMSDASKRVGKNHAYLQQFLDREIPRALPEEVREKLAVLLSLPADQLRHGQKTFRKSVNSVVPSPVPGNHKIPVMGMAEGGADGSYEWNGQVIAYIDPPPYLTGAVDAYAVYVTGTSMEPKYEPGLTLFIHPGKPVTPGCFVLIQANPKADGEAPRAFIKRLVKRTPTKLVLEQYSPPKTIEMPLDGIMSVHRIVGSEEA